MSDRGWRLFSFEQAVADWAAQARRIAVPLTRDETLHRDWLRCGGTWFVGVNLLPNDETAQLQGGPALSGAAIDHLRDTGLMAPLDRAQVSVIYPGYPKKSSAESDAAFRFRRDRDAAHVDGLLPEGPLKRRYLREPHAFVLGLPLNDSTASPMVIWEGSHEIMRAAFAARLDGIDPQTWSGEDLTDTYHAARKRCFERCQRIEIRARPGEAYLIHRLALHGVAPWREGETAPPEGRMIAYFRPELRDIAQWLA
ncbi:hypothetical protein C8N43_0210 [Litoreibacter ponti]|uniref:Phytanoyl-CoA dioxygenase PhyH n=1 Tax=Litoreibacter ponti TaxID=1510457 RepID=A0A2T6BHN4_9RHOB|nr:hypothetical protein [Litoreibacter ponti]PTX55571.1 hypothetical protein C8N43_0210 [Litoreibacter ponti]